MHALILALLLPQLTQVPQANGDEIDPRFELRRTPVVRVVEQTSPAVVYIQTDMAVQRDWFGRVFQPKGAGSGVVILPEGFIVTNNHVVRNATSITVSFDPKHDKRTYPAQLVSAVPNEDLALLKIPHERDFPTIPLGTSSDLMPGETVIALGNPLGQTHSVSQGIISGLHRNVDIADRSQNLHFTDLIQTDASINFGNSGGPLLNIHGELIGINSVVNVQAENIGFAIPVDRVREVLEDQLLDPETASSFLGFDVARDDRLVVDEVLPGRGGRPAGRPLRPPADGPHPALGQDRRDPVQDAGPDRGALHRRQQQLRAGRARARERAGGRARPLEGRPALRRRLAARPRPGAEPRLAGEPRRAPRARRGDRARALPRPRRRRDLRPQRAAPRRADARVDGPKPRRAADDILCRPAVRASMFKALLQFSERFGNMLSRTLLTVLYFALLGPFALVYRLAADPLHLRPQRGGNWTEWRSRNDTLPAARRQD
jgi:S1-C subfamily serine protease